MIILLFLVVIVPVEGRANDVLKHHYITQQKHYKSATYGTGARRNDATGFISLPNQSRKTTSSIRNDRVNVPKTFLNDMVIRNRRSQSRSSTPFALYAIDSSSIDTLTDFISSTRDMISQKMSSIIESSSSSLSSIRDFVADSDLKQQISLPSIPILTDSFQSLSSSFTPYINDVIVPILTNTSPILLFVISTISTYVLFSSILQLSKPIPSTSPYPNNNQYDPMTAKLYFDSRLNMVLLRTLTIASLSFQFGIKVLLDQLKKNEDNVDLIQLEEQRGIELATLLTQLGPTFIKVGQSLSIRTDLLSPSYIRGLSTLQDQVPSFDTAIAKTIIQNEWNCISLSDIIFEDDLSIKPIAAASLGQVYKATLKDINQTQIAIKVQRPNILEQIALDMYIIREVGNILKRIFNLNTDTVGTVDAWGIGFVNELNYIQEAKNGIEFNQNILNTPLKDVVFSPNVIEKYTTRSVLVTEWINGERLDQSNSNDISILCSIAMNSYLTMLLEFGTLHCDPHPGNLLRTNDGKLCILDWGMVTEINKDLQLTLIEHMAHLTSADYEEVPRDLLLLGFIPESKANLIDDSGVVDVLADIYSTWTAGGGAATIDVNKVVSQLQDLTTTKGNIFQIPPYFAYIAKAFSVLEGIGLSNQPGKYSIINECLPYVSKRLLSDKDTMGPALSTFIFGPYKSDPDRIVNYKRVKQLIEGFSQYTTTSSSSVGTLLGKDSTSLSGVVSRTQLIEESADTILDLIFTEDETPLQQIVLEQMAKIISSSGRYLFTELRERSGYLTTGRTILGTALDPFGIFRTSPLIRTNQLDEETVETTRKLLALIQNQIIQTPSDINNKINPMFDLTTLSRDETIELTFMLIRKVWAKRIGVFKTSNRFTRTLLQLTADKLEKGERDTRIIPENKSLLSSSSKIQQQQQDALQYVKKDEVLYDDLPKLSPGSTTSPNLVTVVRTSAELETTILNVSIRPGTSSRLDNARKLLQDIQQQKLKQEQQ